MGTLPLWAILFGALAGIAFLVKRRSDLAQKRDVLAKRSAHEDGEPDLPVPFGYKCAWFAVRTENPLSVAAHLSLRGIRTANWREGVQKAYQASVFVSPPERGWILAAGRCLANVSPFPQAITPSVEALSLAHGEALFFATDRITETHVWARARSGVLERAFGYSGESGEILWDQGSKTEEEISLSFDFPNEETVMGLARRWCICPLDLPYAESAPALGLVGKH
jgi:hypothetical protein